MMKNIKRSFLLALCMAISSLVPTRGFSQSTELQQLLLNIEKLTQLKSILSDMKTGYQVYQQGYGIISNLSKGNFNLHNGYLSGLLAISPAVRNYRRIPEIVAMQVSLVQEYRQAFRRFRQSKTFLPAELDYMSKVYQQLTSGSLKGIEELINVTTAGKLRMSDAERLEAINRIYADTTDKLIFLRSFNRQGISLSLSRTREIENTSQLKRLYDLTQ